MTAPSLRLSYCFKYGRCFANMCWIMKSWVFEAYGWVGETGQYILSLGPGRLEGYVFFVRRAFEITFFFFFCLEVSHISNRDLAKRSASMEIRGQSFAVILIYIEELENSRYWVRLPNVSLGVCQKNNSTRQVTFIECLERAVQEPLLAPHIQS